MKLNHPTGGFRHPPKDPAITRDFTMVYPKRIQMPYESSKTTRAENSLEVQRFVLTPELSRWGQLFCCGGGGSGGWVGGVKKWDFQRLQEAKATNSGHMAAPSVFCLCRFLFWERVYLSQEPGGEKPGFLPHWTLKNTSCKRAAG